MLNCTPWMRQAAERPGDAPSNRVAPFNRATPHLGRQAVLRTGATSLHSRPHGRRCTARGETCPATPFGSRNFHPLPFHQFAWRSKCRRNRRQIRIRCRRNAPGRRAGRVRRRGGNRSGRGRPGNPESLRHGSPELIPTAPSPARPKPGSDTRTRAPLPAGVAPRVFRRRGRILLLARSRPARERRRRPRARHRLPHDGAVVTPPRLASAPCAGRGCSGSRVASDRPNPETPLPSQPESPGGS